MRSKTRQTHPWLPQSPYLSEASRNILQPRPIILPITYPPLSIIPPDTTLPLLPVACLGRTEISTIPHLRLAVRLGEVLDLRLLAVDLGVELLQLVSGGPESDDRVLAVLDGLRVGAGDTSQGVGEVLDGAGRTC